MMENRAKIFNNFSRRIAAAGSASELYELLSLGLYQLIEASGTGIFILDDDGQHLDGVLGRPQEVLPETVKIRISLDDPASIAAAAFRSGKPVTVADARTDPRGKKWLVNVYNIKSLLALPLKAGNNPVGAAVIVDTKQKREFSDEDIDISMRLIVRAGKRFRKLSHDREGILTRLSKLLREN